MSFIHTDYLESIYYKDSYKMLVDKSAKILKAIDKIHPFQSIAFSGMSGAAMAYPLSLKLNKDLTCVRKGKSHFSSDLGLNVEGRIEAKYIIVDDFICTGATIKRILKTLKKDQRYHGASTPEVVAIYLYASNGNEVGFNPVNIPIYTQRDTHLIRR